MRECFDTGDAVILGKWNLSWHRNHFLVTRSKCLSFNTQHVRLALITNKTCPFGRAAAWALSTSDRCPHALLGAKNWHTGGSMLPASVFRIGHMLKTEDLTIGNLRRFVGARLAPFSSARHGD